MCKLSAAQGQIRKQCLLSAPRCVFSRFPETCLFPPAALVVFRLIMISISHFFVDINRTYRGFAGKICAYQSKHFCGIFIACLLTKARLLYIIAFVAGIAQLVEQRIRNAQVACSSHVSSSIAVVSRVFCCRTAAQRVRMSAHPFLF